MEPWPFVFGHVFSQVEGIFWSTQASAGVRLEVESLQQSGQDWTQNLMCPCLLVSVY